MARPNDPEPTDPQPQRKQALVNSLYRNGGFYVFAGATAVVIVLAYVYGAFDMGNPTAVIQQEQAPSTQSDPAQSPQ